MDHGLVVVVPREGIQCPDVVRTLLVRLASGGRRGRVEGRLGCMYAGNIGYYSGPSYIGAGVDYSLAPVKLWVGLWCRCMACNVTVTKFE